MPQLDFGNWFNQTTSVLLGFWLLVYLFIFIFLTQGVWLMKFRTKLSSLRGLLSSTFATQTTSLGSEVNAVQLVALTQALTTNISLVSTAAGEHAIKILSPSIDSILNVTANAATVLEVVNTLTLDLPEEDLQEEA